MHHTLPLKDAPGGAPIGVAQVVAEAVDASVLLGPALDGTGVVGTHLRDGCAQRVGLGQHALHLVRRQLIPGNDDELIQLNRDPGGDASVPSVLYNICWLQQLCRVERWRLLLGDISPSTKLASAFI